MKTVHVIIQSRRSIKAEKVNKWVCMYEKKKRHTSSTHMMCIVLFDDGCHDISPGWAPFLGLQSLLSMRRTSSYLGHPNLSWYNSSCRGRTIRDHGELYATTEETSGTWQKEGYFRVLVFDMQVRATGWDDLFTNQSLFPVNRQSETTLDPSSFDLPSFYKHSITFFRALHSLARLIPAFSLHQRLQEDHKFSLCYRIGRGMCSYLPDELPPGKRHHLNVFPLLINLYILDWPLLEGDHRSQSTVYKLSDVSTPIG
jgi:hypothetical protein